VSVALEALDGIESVKVSLEKASADIRLKPDNKITLPQMRRVIRRAGYPTKDAEITARGRIVGTGAKSAVDLLNGSTLPLAEAPRETPAGIVEITGVSKPGKKDAEALTLTSIK
jgi:copper chaperone CopZ